MKKLLFLFAVMMSMASARAMTIISYSATNFYSSYGVSGIPLTNNFTLTPISQGFTIFGSSLIGGPPQIVAPTNSPYLFGLEPNRYRFVMNGIPTGLTLTVPNNAITNNFTDLLDPGLTVYALSNWNFFMVIDPNDTTPGRLGDKLVAGSGVSFSTNNVGGNEQILLSFSTNLNTFISQIGFTNGAIGFLANSNGFAIINTNGGIAQVTTNMAFLLTNRLGGLFNFGTNVFMVLLPGSGGSLQLSNGQFTVHAAQTVDGLTVNTNFSVGPASFVVGTSTVEFTNATQAGINGAYQQISSTIWTNILTGDYVLTNGTTCFLINSLGQTLWTSPTLINGTWIVGANGTGAAPGSRATMTMFGTFAFGGLVSATNAQMSGIFGGTFSGSLSNSISSGGNIVVTNDSRPLILTGSNVFNTLNISNAANVNNLTVTGAVTLIGQQFIDTNWFSVLNLGGVIISPVTNLPANILSNACYFSPARGTDYVNQAVNALVQSTNRYSVGGGKITIVGTNFYPNPIVFTNLGTFPGGSMSFHLTSPAFMRGALVCATNPAIRVQGQGEAGVSFEMDHLLISSLDNSLTNLFEVKGTFGRLDIGFNWFVPWAAATNNKVSGVLVGLTPPTTGVSGFHDNLVVFLEGDSSDKAYVHDNSFSQINSVHFNGLDHGNFSRNAFSYCGGNNQWPNTSRYSLGANLNYVTGIHGDLEINDNFYYAPTSGRMYFFSGSGLEGNSVELFGEQAEVGILAALTDTSAQILFINPHQRGQPQAVQGTLVTNTNPYQISFAGSADFNQVRIQDFLNPHPYINFPVNVQNNLDVDSNLTVSVGQMTNALASFLTTITTFNSSRFFVGPSLESNVSGVYIFDHTNLTDHYAVWTNSSPSTNVIVFDDPAAPGIYILEPTNEIGTFAGPPFLYTENSSFYPQILTDLYGFDNNVTFAGVTNARCSLFGDTIISGNISTTNLQAYTITVTNGIGSFGTNWLSTFNAGGITNTASVNLTVYGFTGTGVTLSNKFSKFNSPIGTITSPQNITLQPGDMLYGSSCAESTNRYW